MPPGDELGAGVEHLVLGVATGEFGADGIPGQFHELDLFFRRTDGGFLGRVDIPVEIGVGKILGRGRQHDQPAACEFAHRRDEFRIELLGENLCCVHQITVGHVVAVEHTAAGFHAVDEAFDHRRLGCHVAELFGDGRNADRADGFAHAARHADLELHFHGLIVLHVMGIGILELGPGGIRVLVDEDPFPRHFHIVAIDQRIVLVIARRQGIIERTRRRFLV